MNACWIEATRGYLSGWKHRLPRRTGVRVLCYHGVVERRKDPRLERNLHLCSQFKDHLRVLRRLRLRVWSLEELMSELSNPSKHRLEGIMITFDDGYANTLYAAEWLERERLPWTLFISTGVVGRAKTLWTVELSLLLLHGHASRVDVLSRSWPLRSRGEREEAFQHIRYSMKKMPSEQRRQVMDEIRQQFPEGETQRLLEAFPSLQMLTWDEIRQLANAEVEVGSHGVYHEIHHSDQPKGIRLHELAHSKQTIERELGKSCLSFAFPNGDFVSSSPEEVRQAGYEAAFTLKPRSVHAGDNPYLLPRLGARGSVALLVQQLFWDA